MKPDKFHSRRSLLTGQPDIRQYVAYSVCFCTAPNHEFTVGYLVNAINPLRQANLIRLSAQNISGALKESNSLDTGCCSRPSLFKQEPINYIDH